MAYNKNTDYQAKINEAVKNGDYDSAARYENERNEKIEKENLSYEKTNKYSAPKGVNGTTQNKIQSSFEPSQKVTNADNMASQALSNVIKTTSKDKVISDEVYELLGQSFEVPAAVTEADAYLKQQLEKIQSGKTSYTDQIKDMMDKIVNREKFSYDVDTDPLFQQALSSAMKSGNQAMQDTIGQASALTGGYGSTYATSVGNQVYNSFIEDAYDNLPQYYQMALEAYQMEGDEMYRQLGMFNEADDKEFNRTLSAYDTTSQYRNRLWDEAHTLFRDEKTDILSVANLQLAEHGQLSSDAFNAFTATTNYADTMYGREYAKWNDEVNQALQYAQMQNNDYWNQTNFDEGVRQYEQNYAENVRQFDKSYEQTEKWNQAEMDYKNAALKQDNEQFYANLNYQKSKSSGSGSGGSGGSATSKIPSQISSKASKFKTDAERADYLDLMVESGYLTQEQADYLYESNMSNVQKSVEERTWTATSKGGLNWGGGIDKNAKVTDEYNNEYTLGDLWDEASKTMGKDEAESWIIKLQKQLGITWW